MQRLLGVLSGTVPVDMSTVGEHPEGVGVEDLKVGGLTVDDAETTDDEKAESGVTRHLGRLLRILHACLANEQSRKHFDVSPRKGTRTHTNLHLRNSQSEDGRPSRPPSGQSVTHRISRTVPSNRAQTTVGRRIPAERRICE